MILGREGHPLADAAGKLILISTKAEAAAWLKPGERSSATLPIGTSTALTEEQQAPRQHGRTL